jgi:DNA-binding NarL/FixJ family response regulator
MPFRILIADDEPHIRQAVGKIIERHHGWLLCGEASNGVEAIEKAAELQPDLILLDISMPNLDGLSATPRIRDLCPNSGVLILTLHESLGLARMASAAGACGYVAKSMPSSQLVAAIEAFQATGVAPGETS